VLWLVRVAMVGSGASSFGIVAGCRTIGHVRAFLAPISLVQTRNHPPRRSHRPTVGTVDEAVIRVARTCL